MSDQENGRSVLEGELLPPIRRINPDLQAPDGRFKAGNKNAWSVDKQPSNRKDKVRDRIQVSFLVALITDFEKYGASAIVQMRRKKPADYVKVVAAMLPKQFEVKNDAFEGIGADELTAIAFAARDALLAAQGGGDGAGSADEGEPPLALPAVPETEGLP